MGEVDDRKLEAFFGEGVTEPGDLVFLGGW